jgi:hypothetical protein
LLLPHTFWKTLLYSLPLPIILLNVNMYRHYSPRSRFSNGRLDCPFVRTDGVFHPFPTSRRGGPGFNLPRHGGSSFNSFLDDCGFHYLPTRHGGSGFDAPWRGDAGFGGNLGDSIRFYGLLHDRALDYSPTWHGHGGFGFGFEECRSSFDGNLGGRFGFDGRVPDSGIDHSPIWRGHGGSGFAAPQHGHGGSGFAAPWRGDSGFDANFGGGPGFDGHGNDQRIQYSTHCGSDDFDSPWRNTSSPWASRFAFFDEANVPLDSIRRWPRISLDAGEDLSTRRWPRIPLDVSTDVFTHHWPCIPLDAGKDLSTCHPPRIPLDAGEDQATRLWTDATDKDRKDDADDIKTHRHYLPPRLPLDATGPTRDGPPSAHSVRLTEDPEELSTTFPGGSSPDFPQRNPFLPCSTVQTLQERGAFCSDVFCVRSRFGSLLEESIYNLGSVYKEGDVDFRKADAKGRLTNLGKLSLHRWESGISAIHFLFPSQKQASNVRTAEGPHYQATFQDFILATAGVPRTRYSIRFLCSQLQSFH